jgi:hypothetical protein
MGVTFLKLFFEQSHLMPKRAVEFLGTDARPEHGAFFPLNRSVTGIPSRKKAKGNVLELPQVAARLGVV